jgi:hypothetical protein
MQMASATPQDPEKPVITNELLVTEKSLAAVDNSSTHGSEKDIGGDWEDAVG